MAELYLRRPTTGAPLSSSLLVNLSPYSSVIDTEFFDYSGVHIRLGALTVKQHVLVLGSTVPGTTTTDPQTTAAQDSYLIAAVARGEWATGSPVAPTDNKGSTFTAANGPNAYSGFPSSKSAVYAAPIAGGVGHTATLAWGAFSGTAQDEATIAFVEVRSTAGVMTSSFVERTDAATITSASITTTGPALVLAFVFGNAPYSGQLHTFRSTDGYIKVPQASAEGDPDPNGYIQESVFWRYYPTAGTYTATFAGTANEGAQIYLVAFYPKTRLSVSPGAVPIRGTPAQLLIKRAVAATTGNVPITGTAATLTKVGASTTLTADPGAIPITGTDASLLDKPRVIATPGAIAITGTAAGLLDKRVLAAAPGAVPITGTAASLLAKKLVAATAGNVPVTGTAAGLLDKHLVTASPGAVPITGTAAGLLDKHLVSAASGTVPISGTAASLLRQRLVAAAAGLVSITGTNASLLAKHSLAAASGNVPITGISASLADRHAVTASPGAIPVTGTAAALLFKHALPSSPGAVPITGTDATLTKQSSTTFTLTASAGAVPITGTAASLLDKRVLSAGSGTTPITGGATNLVERHTLQASAGTLAVSGVAASLTHKSLVSAGQGSVPITGTDAQLIYFTGHTTLLALSGTVPITDRTVDLRVTRPAVGGSGGYGGYYRRMPVVPSTKPKKLVPPPPKPEPPLGPVDGKALVTITMEPDGINYRLTVQFTSEGRAVAPDKVQLQITPPMQSSTTYAYGQSTDLRKVEKGVYTLDTMPADPGTLRYTWIGTFSNPAKTVRVEGELLVQRTEDPDSWVGMLHNSSQDWAGQLKQAVGMLQQSLQRPVVQEQLEEEEGEEWLMDLRRQLQVLTRSLR